MAQAESISKFIAFVMSWTNGGQQPVAFRGQAYAQWLMVPKLFRPAVGMYDYEKNSVRDLVSVHPQEFRDDVTMFDRLVRMQHFELPTRLLDVTTNPLVALYFASAEFKDEDGKPHNGKVQAFFMNDERQRYYDSDRVSLMANLANLTKPEKTELNAAVKLPKEEFNEHEVVQKLLWFVRLEKPHFLAKIDPMDLMWPVYVKPKLSNRRIIAQSGAFIIYGSRDTTGDEELKVERVMIPASSKREIRSQLERLGIHAGTLFPEIDKAAEHIVRRYTGNA